MVRKSCWCGGRQVKLHLQMGYCTAGIAALLVYFAVADAVLRRRGERRRVSRNGRMENEERAWSEEEKQGNIFRLEISSGIEGS